MNHATIVAVGGAWALAAATAVGQFTPAPSLVRNHPSIAYATAPVTDPVATLNKQLEEGSLTLTHDKDTGYLRSVLEALKVSIDSQVLVFSKTSFQAPKINPKNPRALYYADNVAVGYVRGGDVLEFIGQDARQGGIFYTLDQSPDKPPAFKRNDQACVSCHVSDATKNVPGMFVGSVFPAPDGTTMYGPAYMTDHRSPFDIRWGGWYVNGKHSLTRHMGNTVATKADDLAAMVSDASVRVESLDGRFEPSGFLSHNSDIVSLMVLEHQGYMANLITAVGWSARMGKDAGRPVQETAAELVDYMLFVDEQPLPGPITGPTKFTESFSARGPSDSRGRSLREFDLQTRLMRYPCSYLIYSDAFDALPAEAKTIIYGRMWEILTGRDQDERYTRLSSADRKAVIEILRETKQDLPSYWDASTTF